MMKKNILSGLLALVLTGYAGSALAAAPDAKCGGCEKMRAAEDKLATVSLTDDQKIHDLLDAASKSILGLPRAKDNRLNEDQIKQMVALLVQVVKVDNMHLVLQDVAGIIKANKVEFDREVGRVGGERGRKLSDYVIVVLDEETTGSDPAPEKKRDKSKAGDGKLNEAKPLPRR